MLLPLENQHSALYGRVHFTIFFNFYFPDGLQTGPSLSWANRPPPRGVRSGDSVKVWQLTPEFYHLFFCV